MITITNSIHECPSEAYSSWRGQEIPRNLWNPKIIYRVHKTLPLDTVLI
jgi:hypothetical protein